MAADVAVIFGSGLAALPAGARVESEASFAALGWPSLGVPGHEPRVLRVTLPLEGPAGGEAALRAALVFGRPHAYEGWSEDELERPLTDLAAAGVRRVLLTNASGSLAPGLSLGDVLVATELVDLQAELGARPRSRRGCRSATGLPPSASRPPSPRS